MTSTLALSDRLEQGTEAMLHLVEGKKLNMFADYKEIKLSSLES
jgi:hypothetical protein